MNTHNCVTCYNTGCKVGYNHCVFCVPCTNTYYYVPSDTIVSNSYCNECFNKSMEIGKLKLEIDRLRKDIEFYRKHRCPEDRGPWRPYRPWRPYPVRY